MIYENEYIFYWWIVNISFDGGTGKNCATIEIVK